MDKYVVLEKKDLENFIAELSKKQKVVAPVSKGYNNFAFEEVTTGRQVALKYIPTILPPKKYFMPQKENILSYNKQTKEWIPVVTSEELIIFGVHTCDLAGIEFLHLVMGQEPKDANYLIRKDKITVIGLECNEYCDEYASCAVMNNHLPKGGYDLFFTELEQNFIVHVNTEVGGRLVKETKIFSGATEGDLKALEALREKKKETFKPEVDIDGQELHDIFKQSFDSKEWESIGERCVACGNCTTVCPTCYCFDIRDNINLDFNAGVRYRVWDSCQNEEFAKVAGGENFREERAHRQRHRYMRKFNYPVNKSDTYACTGCGRCSRTCMADINLKETINALAKENI